MDHIEIDTKYTNVHAYHALIYSFQWQSRNIFSLEFVVISTQHDENNCGKVKILNGTFAPWAKL